MMSTACIIIINAQLQAAVSGYWFNTLKPWTMTQASNNNYQSYLVIMNWDIEQISCTGMNRSVFKKIINV